MAVLDNGGAMLAKGGGDIGESVVARITEALGNSSDFPGPKKEILSSELKEKHHLHILYIKKKILLNSTRTYIIQLIQCLVQFHLLGDLVLFKVEFVALQ